MHTIVDGTRYRLRFVHYFKPGVKGKRGRQGTTECLVEMWAQSMNGTTVLAQGWIPITSGMAVCGRSERGFQKEQGRQFSLVRALRNTFPGDTNELKGALVRAYVESGKAGSRMACYDLWLKGYNTLYDAVFSEDWPIKGWRKQPREKVDAA